MGGLRKAAFAIALALACACQQNVATPPLVGSSPVPTASLSATAAPAGAIPDGFRIQVPRLGIDLPIREGDVARDIDQQNTPESAAFHLPQTGIPGGGSNTYLYAHARQGMFLELWDARVDDEVVVVRPDGVRLSYRVTEILPRVGPRDFSVIQPTPDERVTLQTSTGPNPGDPRFVVVARPG